MSWWLSLPVGIAAYVVMPDGPWYRELGAALLVLISDQMRAHIGDRRSAR